MQAEHFGSYAACSGLSVPALSLLGRWLTASAAAKERCSSGSVLVQRL